MKTEDDTFRVLSRPNIHEMIYLHQQWRNTFANNSFDSRWNINFLEKHGWDWVEFLKAKKAAGYTF